jgi:hypothetical protein
MGTETGMGIGIPATATTGTYPDAMNPSFS